MGSLAVNMVEVTGFKTKLQQQILERVKKTQKQFEKIKQERELEKSRQFTKSIWTDRKSDGVIVYVNYESMERGPVCKQVESLLATEGFEYQKVEVNEDLQKWCEIISMIPDAVREIGRISVPQVFYQNQWVGGSDLLSNQHKLASLKQDKLPWLEGTALERQVDVQQVKCHKVSKKPKRVYRMKGQRDDDPWCIPEEYL